MGTLKLDETDVAGDPRQFLTVGKRNNIVEPAMQDKDRPRIRRKSRPVVIYVPDQKARHKKAPSQGTGRGECRLEDESGQWPLPGESTGGPASK